MRKRDFTREVILSPYFTMAVAVAMYVAKVVLKVIVGTWVNSPVITGDGYHNLADIFAALLVFVAIYLSRLPKSSKYPFGRKNIESLLVLGVGISLFVLTIQILAKSLVGVAHQFPMLDTELRSWVDLPEFEAVRVGGDYAVWVFGVIGGSFILSFVVSRYQIYVGKMHSHPSLEADGLETAIDGKIEFAALLGIGSEYIFGAPWLEYLFGLVIAVLVAHTGWEMFLRGWRALLQRSIGKDKENAIREISRRVEGVSDVANLATFCVGSSAVALLTVTSRARQNMIKHIRRTLEMRIGKYLKDQGYGGQEIYVRLEMPDPHFYRVAEAIVKDGETVTVACNLGSATHVRIYDIEREKPVRATDESVSGLTLNEVVTLLERKRVSVFSLFFPDEAVSAAVNAIGVEFKLSPMIQALADRAI